MPKQKKTETTGKTPSKRAKHSDKIVKVRHDNPRKLEREWKKRLRPRKKLIPRGTATAIGISVVKNKLRTINANLSAELRREQPPIGFGELGEELNRGEELLACLAELRELITSLSFHLDLDDVTTLPTYVSVAPKLGAFELSSKDYRDLLNAKDKKVGTIGLVGLVNRYSSAVFSDHHGLVIHAKIDGKPDLNIYYQSLDATNSFSGGTSVRSESSLLPFTFPSNDLTGSLRGAVGFSEQVSKLMITRPDINVVILAEVGMHDALRLMPKRSFGREWACLSNNSKKQNSGVNDITMLCDPNLVNSYKFDVGASDIGNMATITSDTGCVLAGCHILNKQANNKAVGAYLKKSKLSAVFGDTNISTRVSSSLAFGFETIESNRSLTDTLSFSFSNSASDKMFDKLLVRTT